MNKTTTNLYVVFRYILFYVQNKHVCSENGWKNVLKDFNKNKTNQILDMHNYFKKINLFQKLYTLIDSLFYVYFKISNEFLNFDLNKETSEEYLIYSHIIPQI